MVDDFIKLSYVCFKLVEVTTTKGPLTQIKKLAGKAHQFTKCVKKAAGHLRRLGDENDKERWDWFIFSFFY